MAQTFRVARYRFRATFGRRWGGYLAIVLLIGLVGGIAMGAIAGARRTQSSYPAFLKSTNPSDVTLPTALYGLNGAKTGYDPAILEKIAHLPHVKAVESSAGPNASVVNPDGSNFHPSGPNINVSTEGSVNGLLVDQDRVTITSGRMLDPARANEFIVSAAVAKALRAHVGAVIPFAFYTNQQESEPGPSGDQYRPHPYLRLNMKLVGIGLLNNAIVQDDVDAAGSNFSLFGPALMKRLRECCAQSTQTGLRLVRGSRDVPAVEKELEQLSPLLSTHISLSSVDAAKAERAIEPESIAFGVFGLIAALAALLIASQVIGRQLRAGADELDALRALGAGPAMITADGLIGVLGAIIIGALLAAAIAVALSPLVAGRRGTDRLPLARYRVRLDRPRPRRVDSDRRAEHGRGCDRAPPSTASGGPPPEIGYGAQLACGAGRRGLGAPRCPRLPECASRSSPGRGRSTVPVRSAILGAALAIVVVVSTLTFGASLHTLVTSPALYGWNWDYELSGGNGVGAIPQALAATALRRDPDVAAWTGAYFTEVQVDGRAVPAVGGDLNATVGPPLLSGHALQGTNEIVLGANTLHDLHKKVGDIVSVNTAGPKRLRMQIAGTATMPAIGGSGEGTLHLEMGTGALFASQLIPAKLRNVVGNLPIGPNAMFVRFRPGVNRSRAVKRLNQIADKLSLPTNWGVTVTSVQRPAEIVNYRSMSTTPLYLGAALAAGAIVALALTLVTSVRRRRRDLALLKALGFTRRQLAAVVAWQATVAVAIGTIIGVPAGIVLGRALWKSFANQIHAVPKPIVPVLPIVLVALGALVLANLVAAIPGRQAARTQTAELLRAE